MSNFKGTKGKWSVSRCQISEEIRVGSRLFTVANVYSYDILGAENDIEEAKANAQLIAHATEMLEMLEAKMYYLDNGSLAFYEKYNYNAAELSTKTRELIKKATEI